MPPPAPPPGSAPEIAVSGNGTNIADGDTTPSGADFTDFGSAAQGGAAVLRTFTVSNTGSSTLTTSGLTLPAGFTLVEGLAASIAAGASDTFQVRLDTATAGTKSGQINFTNNDGDENPFNFTITGTVIAAPPPAEITVLGNGISIADNDPFPSSTDHTDFGIVTQGVVFVRTFTVRNDGGSTLTLGTPTLPAGFLPVAGDPLVSSLAPGQSDTFQVRLDTASTGTKGGQISFTNNDSNENPFNFIITGTVTIFVNHAPAGADRTVTALEDIGYVFAASDFGFSDPNDNPANAFAAVRITTLPSAGTLRNSGAAVTAGQFVSVAAINSGQLVFTPAADANGNNHASFTFQVQDNGGTANGGVDLDQSPNVITFDATAVNDPPAGADRTLATLEDTGYVFAAADFGFSDPNDNPANAFAAVRIATLPSAGTLRNSGAAVTAGQFIGIADIDAGRLVFTPAANANGNNHAIFTFQVQDNGGTANGGVDLDQSPNAIAFHATPLNDAPAGADRTLATLEDTGYVFTASDFGFSDPNDNPANAFAAVRITTLPGAGTLINNGAAVIAGQFVSVAAVNSGQLVFTPAANANGNNYAIFTFQVQDDGGTASGGVDLDQSPNAIAFHVTPIADAPAGADRTLTTLEDTGYAFTAADFGFSDPTDNPINALAAVRIATLPSAGTLTNNGAAVTAGQFVGVADIDAGRLVFTPAANANGNNYASFTFQVQDNGGTASGGVDLDQSPNTLVVNVTPVNDAPAGADRTATILQHHPYAFAASDFGFSDPDDNPANALAAVRIATLPLAGALTLNGAAVTAGQFVSLADIAGGSLAFVPAANAFGDGHTSFTFQVQDNGGTANGGADLDPSPNSLTFNVRLAPPNDFDRDRDSDILLRRTDGMFALDVIDNLSIQSASLLGGVGNENRVAGIGDFDRDGDSDMLMRNDDGAFALYRFQAGAIQSAAVLGGVGNEWHAAGFGDFDGDGDSDMLTRHDDGTFALYRFEAGQIQSGAVLGGVGNEIHVAGIGDFDRDGDADMLTRHDNGIFTLYQFQAGAIQSAAVLGGVGNEIRVAGIGDFDRDGDADMLMRHDNGDFILYRFEAGQVQSASLVGGVGLENRVAGIGDYDRDGDADMLMRHDIGTMAIYQFEAGQVQSAAIIGGVGLEWLVV